MNTTVHELNVMDCFDLLRPGGIGRVAVSTPVGPRIAPVTFTVVDRALVFRTSPYSEVATYGRNVEAAMEVDCLDYERRQGWSVVAVGRLFLVDDPDEVLAIRQASDPAPWVDGLRQLYMKLVWRDLSGRRLGPLPSVQTAAAPLPV